MPISVTTPPLVELRGNPLEVCLAFLHGLHLARGDIALPIRQAGPQAYEHGRYSFC